MYALEIREEIDSAIEFYGKEMPPAIRRAISHCNSHLYNGPLYFDRYGNECSCFDKGAKQYNWNDDLDAIRAGLEDIPDCQAEISFNEETGESEFETIDGSREQILRALVGKELLSYL